MIENENPNPNNNEDINKIFTSPFTDVDEHDDFEVNISEDEILNRITMEILTNKSILEKLKNSLVERIIANPLLLGSEILNKSINDDVIEAKIDELLTKISPIIKDSITQAIHSNMLSE